MKIKNEKGITAIDIIISIIVITLFVTLIGNLIININLSAKSTERKSQALTYAVLEIEMIKTKGYIEEYDDIGINEEYIKEEDILDINGNFTGYHKKIIIKDYIFIQKEDNRKKENLVKEITVEISYKLGKETKTIELSTYVVRKE